MKRLRVFVTGSGGFIARNILEQLANKYDFVAPGHKQLDLLNSSSVDKFFRKNKHFDFVIHSAIVGGNRKVPNTPQVAVDNLRMFFNVVRNGNYFDRMIHLGSGIEYGKERLLRQIREVDFDKYVPEDNFGFYKYLCGKYIENSSKKIINLRLFGVFGKYEDASVRFISNAICKSILGIPITINQNVFFDYLYINDLVKVVDYFINNRGNFKTYNVGRGIPIDLATIAKKINAIADHKSKIIISKKGLGNEYTCDNSRLLKELGGFKFMDFDESLRELYQWYASIAHTLRRQSFLQDYF